MSKRKGGRRKNDGPGYFYVTIKASGKHKKLRVHTSYASSSRGAREMVIAAFHLPPSAIASVRRAKGPPSV